MKVKALFLICLLSLSSATPLEIQLYKPASAYEKTEMIDDIDKSNFLADLNMGLKYIPLQVELATENVYIVKENQKEKTAPIYNEEIKVEPAKIVGQVLNLEYFSTEPMADKPLNKESNGILGFSLGDLEVKNDKKFVEQLARNRVTTNKSFFFEFEENKNTCKVPTLEEYLGIKGKLFIGDYPYNISPNKYSKNNVKTTPIVQVIKNKEVRMFDDSSLSIQFDMEKCIGCTACVKACSNIAGQNVLACEKKGKAHTVDGKLLSDTNCISCGQCSLACAKKAITEHFDKDSVKNTLKNKNGKIAVCQFAPAIRINMAEALGVPAGTISTGKIVTALKMLGFDYIFDTNFSADMTIVEEATELIHRLNDPDAVLPMFTSCCPAWVNYVEKSRPELIPHLSSCRSPLTMLSSVIKNIFPKKIGVERERIYNVAIMPCTAKKDEIKRPQFSDETDAVITSRELADMIKEAKIDFKNLEETPLDTIYSEFTGGGAIFCATGGVMEAAVRSAYKFITGKDMVPMQLTAVRGTNNGIKTASVDINGIKVNVAVAHGIKNAMDLLAKIKAKEPGFEKIHFLEVMACPGGCVMGGGSPKAKGKKGAEQRIDATYSIDENSKKRVPQDNDQLNKLYEESFDGEYGSHNAHELLHTYYTNRKVYKTWGLNFKQINFNHTSISSFSSQSKLKVEDNFITAPLKFLPVFQREFLNLAKIKDQCKLLTSNKYKFVLCNKDLDIDNFPKLEFYSDELDHTFTFEGKDLFVYDSKNEHFISLIVFDIFTPSETSWVLGLPFLRKEKIFFDMENEKIGVIVNDNKQAKENSLHFLLSLSLILVLCALVVGLYFTIPSKKGRKKRANELVEDYEYTKA